jgi:4-amino-4-deoxychorismate lyase
MYLFIETICYEGGAFQRIELHNARFNSTRKQFFGMQTNLQLELLLSIPPTMKSQTVKCTITYASAIIDIDYSIYKIRPLSSLQMVCSDSIDYSFKFANRTIVNSLFNLRDQSDDILIIKNGFIADTSYANIVFKRKNLWYSPQNPLLKGTRLQSYLNEKRITPALLSIKDLPLFSEARIINAMISIENSPVIRIENINKLI